MIACMDRALGLARVQTPFPASGKSNPEIFDCCDTKSVPSVVHTLLGFGHNNSQHLKGKKNLDIPTLAERSSSTTAGRSTSGKQTGPRMALTTMTPRNALHGIPLRCGRYQLGADKRRYIGRTTRRTNTACLTR